MRRIVATSLACVAASAAALCQEQATTQGIAPLTEASARAVAESTDDPTFNNANSTHMRWIAETLPSEDALARGRVLLEAPFSVVLETPFYRARRVFLDAKRRFLEAPSVSLADLNAGLIVVDVSAYGHIGRADDVETVVLKRLDAIIRPTESTLRMRTMSTALGVSREVTEGRFTFDYSPFAPTAQTVIVVVGKKGNFEIPLSATELSRFR